MRLVIQVFTSIFLASLVLGSFILVAKDYTLYTAFAADHPDKWLWAAIGWMILSLGSVWGIVAVFLKRHKLGWITGSALGIYTVLLLVLQPGLDATRGNDPKVTGMGIAVFGMIGMLLLILLHTSLKPDSAILPKSK